MAKKSPLPKGKIALTGITYDGAIGKLILAVDDVAVAMEQKWGIGVLPDLVDAPMREKFVRAYDRLNVAVEAGDYDTVQAAAENVRKGWAKLDEVATQNGYNGIPEYITLTTSEGVEYLLAETPLDARRLAGKLPSKASAIHTRQQVADMLAAAYKLPERDEPHPGNTWAVRRHGCSDLIEDIIPF